MRAVERVLNILESFLNEEGKIGLVELANLSKLNITTTHRIASILVKRGYLNQHYKRGKYSLSLKLLEFRPFIETVTTIGNIAFPFLVELNKKVNESVIVAVLDRNEAVNIEHIESSQNLRFISRVGARLPLHASALGKALLAHVPENELEEFLANNELTHFTENTISAPNILRGELATIRRDQIAVNQEEMQLGVKCVASPIKDGSGKVVAALSISGPSARLNSDRMQELKSLVKNCGLEISKALGYRHDKPMWPSDLRRERIR